MKNAAEGIFSFRRTHENIAVKNSETDMMTPTLLAYRSTRCLPKDNRDRFPENPPQPNIDFAFVLTGMYL